ncbi:hypothetical protein DUNSADRAFT_8681 [Dunaliella salina]|uniref:Encoded protein n=1 Tax=Dunaliella salina TaxID=3046 RepID=A0ABQ7GJ12_DUNSA|nr:hypothetical protein DUNSADRAFT_8681 [Dunaliella salina]|eukprot:KAF5834598.1 hypothetical protein DUNSADRAFT_8681 [Dunaliella salina]
MEKLKSGLAFLTLHLTLHITYSDFHFPIHISSLLHPFLHAPCEEALQIFLSVTRLCRIHLSVTLSDQKWNTNNYCLQISQDHPLRERMSFEDTLVVSRHGCPDGRRLFPTAFEGARD